MARILAFRLGLKKTVFVQSRFDRLFSAGAKPWDLAIAEITITPSRRLTTDFSVPYLSVDEAVLLSKSVAGTTPRTIAGIRGLRICALSKSTGADVVTGRIRPTRPPRLIGNVPTLLLDLQTGKCDAVVYDSRCWRRSRRARRFATERCSASSRPASSTASRSRRAARFARP